MRSHALRTVKITPPRCRIAHVLCAHTAEEDNRVLLRRSCGPWAIEGGGV